MQKPSPIIVTTTFCVTCWTGWISPVAADEDWQVRRLLQPTAEEQLAERQGEVFIYDGLDENTVDRAVAHEFARIQNMMFVRVKPAEPEEEGWMDDGCD